MDNRATADPGKDPFTPARSPKQAYIENDVDFFGNTIAERNYGLGYPGSTNADLVERAKAGAASVFATAVNDTTVVLRFEQKLGRGAASRTDRAGQGSAWRVAAWRRGLARLQLQEASCVADACFPRGDAEALRRQTQKRFSLRSDQESIEQYQLSSAGCE